MIETGANTLSVAPGTPYLWSLGQQSISERSRVERIQVILPRDEFHSIASSLDAATGTILNNPLGRLLSDYLVALDRWLPSISAEDSRRLAAVMHSMISACIAPSSDRVAAAETGMSCARKERVRRIIHQHLRSPELSPSTICKMGGVSRSQMYRLFEHDGGVAHYIQRLRLQAAYAILSDPSSTRRIYEIASDFCFEDASSFTRAFRHEFDCAPRDVRAAALDGLPLVANVGAQREKAGTRFVDFLA
jgi:AraC-like DNA-binding protein